MTNNQRQLIKWSECDICNEKDKGILRDDYEHWAIPPDDILKRNKITRKDFIKQLIKGGPTRFLSRDSSWRFLEKHWECDGEDQIITRKQFEDYWDNDNWRGVWPFTI